MSGVESPTPSDSDSTRWLEKAADDLEVADLVLGSTVADFPRTHSLERLADLLGSEGDVFDRSVLFDLTPWAVAGRYPEDMPEPTQELATRLVAGARSVVSAARAYGPGQAKR